MCWLNKDLIDDPGVRALQDTTANLINVTRDLAAACLSGEANGSYAEKRASPEFAVIRRALSMRPVRRG